MKSKWLAIVASLLLSNNAIAIAKDEAEKELVSGQRHEEAETLRMLKKNKTKLKKSKKVKKKKSKKDKKNKKKSKNEYKGKECGVDYCDAKVISLGGLKTCLKDNFDHLSDVFFPEDGFDYLIARQNGQTLSRLPAAVVYVEDVEGVQKALSCAIDNGYKVSPRGGNHSFQGLGTMDGYVVIDMGSTCKPDEFVVDKTDQGPHILQGSKYVGTIKAQAGCTNAVMLAAGHKHFNDQAGLTLIGACPTVGITGFVLGGGGGDISPYLGYAIDIVKEFQLVLYDGTVVTASEEENSDLYWASRGGSGGNGVITHLTYKIVEAPTQKYEDEGGKKYTQMAIIAFIKDVENGAKRLQEWFYDADPVITGKFGGSFNWYKAGTVGAGTPPFFRFVFVYLGSWKEGIEELKSTGILDTDLFQFAPVGQMGSFPASSDKTTMLTENYEVVCKTPSTDPTCPAYEEVDGALTDWPGVIDSKYPFIAAFQFDTYAEVEAFHICTLGSFIYTSQWWQWSYTSGDFCKDLDLDDEKCEEITDPAFDLPYKVPKSCNDKDVLNAMLEKAEDPTSFINSHGPSVKLTEYWAPLFAEKYGIEPSSTAVYEYLMENGKSDPGASMFQRFEDSFFAKLLNETSGGADHLVHGAALNVKPDETAYPWRNAALMVDYDGGIEAAKDFLTRFVEGGYTPQGYYAYLNPFGQKNWRSYFFGNHWRKLSEIRAKYDPKDVFGKPLTIESIGE